MMQPTPIREAHEVIAGLARLAHSEMTVDRETVERLKAEREDA